MKDIILPVEVTVANHADVLHRVLGGCLHCGGDLRLTGVPLVTRDRPTRCPRCGVEHRVDLSADGRKARIRLPRNCDVWLEVESTNLSAAGRRGADLIVRFKAGAEYLYPGAGPLLPELLAAESSGRFFHARVRPLPFKKLD